MLTSKYSEYKNLSFVSCLVKEISDLLETSFLKKPDEIFFRTLVGLDEISCLKDEVEDLKKLQLFIFYLRLTGGIDVSLKEHSGKFYFVNFNTIIENNFSVSKNPDLKNRNILIEQAIEKHNKNSKNYFDSNIKDNFLNSLKEDFHYYTENDVNNLVIITHNRNDTFKNCLFEYIANIKRFKHKNIKIIVSDDSDLYFSKQNRIIVEEAKKIYPEIEYLDSAHREQVSNKLIETCIDTFSDVNPEKFKHLIPYTFGTSGFPSSYGRNRNFVSHYLLNNSYISVDDDSLPKVLTFGKKTLVNAIEKMFSEKCYDLSLINNFLDFNSNDTKLIHVDFIGYFRSFNPSVLKYTRYSGDKDVNLYFHIIGSLGIEPQEAGAFELFDKSDPEKIIELKREFPYITFTYKDNENSKHRMHGLCCYFPKEFNKMRVTIPEKLRLEDIFFGINFFVESGLIPVETNFALFHDKIIDSESITVKDIHMEVISIVLHYIYLEIISKFNGNVEDIILDLNNALKKESIIIPNSIFKFIDKHKTNIIKLFENCLEIERKNNDTEGIKKLEQLISDSEQEFFALTKEEDYQKTSMFINKVINKYVDCLILWQYLIKIKTDH